MTTASNSATLVVNLAKIADIADLAALMNTLRTLSDVISGLSSQPRFWRSAENCHTPAGDILQSLLGVIHLLSDEASDRMENMPALAGSGQWAKAQALVATRALEHGLEHRDLAAYAMQIAAQLDSEGGEYRMLRTAARR